MTDREKIEEIRQVLIALQHGELKNDFAAIIAITAIVVEPNDLDRQRAEELNHHHGWIKEDDGKTTIT